ncbi:MAG: xanthine dehydrogenase family protein molybdopterin-binding subunit [Pseudomonadota bacterium]
MSGPFDMTRRQFIKLTAATTGGLTLGFTLPGCGRNGATPAGEAVFRPNAWLAISRTRGVTVFLAESEMGQGVMTSIPMLIAEELEVSLDAITIERAPLSEEFGSQSTGGSTSVRQGWDVLRRAGATARMMLIAAAATKWAVPVAECRAENGAVVHAPSGRQFSYRELCDDAARQPVPAEVTLKQPEQFRLIGSNPLPTDCVAKTTGSAIFGIDVNVPGMLVATIRHCPVFGGRLARLDESRARQVPGVRHVVVIESGVAVVADHFWAAKQGADALTIEWDEGPHATLDQGAIFARFAALAESDAGEIVREESAPAAPAVQTLRAVYEAPFQAHATMEPMNCTAYVHDGRCEVWVPTQSPSAAQEVAAAEGLSRPREFLNKLRRKIDRAPLQDVQVNTTLLGGGFGRRLDQDFVAEAVQISKAVGAPVKLIWTREEDIQHDHYRPATYNRLTASLDASGNIVSWEHHIVGDSLGKSSGGATHLPYPMPNFRVRFSQADHPVPVGSWRSVGHSQNGFIVESFIDELAAAARQDPYHFRLKLLAQSPRAAAVTKLAAEKAGWGSTGPGNRHQGIAYASCFGSHVAQVAEVSVDTQGGVRVHRVVCAVDCGIVVNPDTVRAQLEGGIIFGMTATLKGAITIGKGRVQQANFHDFPLLRMDETPLIDVHIVPSTEAPGGIGEVGVPPIAPAIANALYVATGVRVRKLPILPADLITS